MSAVFLTTSRPIPLKKYRLGAEELIEMGAARCAAHADRRPFLGNRARISMGAEELIEMGTGSLASPASPDTGTFLAMGVVAGIATLAFALG